MLKLKDLIENFDLARTALENWTYDADTLDACLECFRISSNAVYPFRQNGRLCFLRLSPTREKQLRNLQGELEFILYLRENNYPALEPIRARSGEYLLTLATRWGDYYASAYYGVPGEPVEDTDFSQEVCFQYGKALGRLHQLSAAYQPRVKKQTHADALDWIRAQLRDLHGEQALLDCADALERDLSALPRDRAHYGLTHYDFECDNVFYDAHTGLCHVIDFEDGMYHFYALDLEQALDSIAEEAPETACDSAKAAFIAGYRTEFAYGQAEAEMLPLMRRFCDLYAYTRLKYCLSESVAQEPEWMGALKEKLTRKAAFLREKLIGG